MTRRTHRYATEVVWTGNRGAGTSSYQSYSRDHEIRVRDKPVLAGSSDPAFRGTPELHVELRPKVVIHPSSAVDMAVLLHERAHELCYIANSVNFPVRCTPTVTASQFSPFPEPA